jgi:hypothetical protein
MKPVRIAFAAIVTTFMSVAAANGIAREGSIASRETYDISLERTSGFLLTAHGRTVVETHAGCGATHTIQRSLSDVTYKDGRPIRTDFAIETWESGDGRTLRFRVRNTQDGDQPETHAGTATLSAAGSGRVAFTSKDNGFALPSGTMFPNAFSRAMFEAATQGHDVANRTIFQGGGKSALVAASVKIGRRIEAPHERAKDPSHLLKGKAWPTLISYFPENGELPSSEVAAPLYASGLLGSLSLIYPAFTLGAKLVRVERLPSSC